MLSENSLSGDMKILVTGGAGFIGSHIAEFFSKENEVIVLDNLSRFKLIGRSGNALYNWNYLKQYKNIKLIKGDVTNFNDIKKILDVSAIIHAAAQVAVTTSIKNPREDFLNNVLGTFNILESARKYDSAVLYFSTNKVYGNNVNKIPIREGKTRYYLDKKFSNGIDESFPIDLCEHTPYGCSKLAGDLYVQDYSHTYGLKTGVFRCSCIYGTRQFGLEDQGWIAHFVISTILGKPITIYGDGKQVRDVLYVSDLVNACDKFIKIGKSDVFNIGGGPRNTLSLLELLDIIEKETKKTTRIKFSDWRPSDQKVYISNISKAKKLLKWEPKINPSNGVKKLINWVNENKNIF